MSELRLADFSSLPAEAVEDAVAIYRQEFDVPWEWPAARISGLATLSGGAGSLCRGLALLEDGTLAGIAVVQYLTGSNLHFLRYMAIDHDRRGRGLGSRLLAEVAFSGEEMARAAGRAGCRGTVLEVDTPDAPVDPLELSLRRRRVAFYQRNGVLRPRIVFPRPPGTAPEVPDWELMFLPGRAWQGVIDAATGNAMVQAVFVEGYGRSPEEAWLRSFLAGLSDGLQ